MPMHGLGDNEDRWEIRGAPQCSTDILLQVVDHHIKGEQDTLFSFQLYEELAEILDANVCMDGTVILDASKKAVFTRWASVLDRCAMMIREFVETAVIEPEEKPTNNRTEKAE